MDEWSKRGGRPTPISANPLDEGGIAVGNELLLGDVLDTNSNWLCSQVTGLGARMKRVAMVRDELDAIADEAKASLKRKPDLLVTSGGLGPTTDDITLQGVAQGVGRPVELNPQALKMVQSRYEGLAKAGHVKDGALTDARRKMAYFPKGGLPITNPVGTAPACLLRLKGSFVISLPGVPGELQGIWQGPLMPYLSEVFGEVAYLERALLVHCQDESLLAPILKEVGTAYPQVYIKSRAKEFGTAIKIKVTLSSAGQRMDTVAKAIDEALEDLRTRLHSAQLEVELES
jgi:nicotinamide-nucleotide amidase